MSHINERWAAIDGSVYTEESYLRRVAAGEVKYRPGIAFNVGQMVAEHIVRVHNASLHPQSAQRLDLLRDESISAVVTLKSLGYTYHGGEQWKPLLGSRQPDGIDASRLTASDSNLSGLPPPFDSQEEAQRAAGAYPVQDGYMSIEIPAGAAGVRVYNGRGALLHDSQAAAPGMSSVMQPQGSSLRQAEIGRAVVASVPTPKPCCGCRNA